MTGRVFTRLQATQATKRAPPHASSGHAQMVAVPRTQGLWVLALEEDAADACDTVYRCPVVGSCPLVGDDREPRAQNTLPFTFTDNKYIGAHLPTSWREFVGKLRDKEPFVSQLHSYRKDQQESFTMPAPSTNIQNSCHPKLKLNPSTLVFELIDHHGQPGSPHTD